MSKGIRLQKNGLRMRGTSIPVGGRVPGKNRLKKFKAKKTGG